jgi:ketosteroid isomerase-like protein
MADAVQNILDLERRRCAAIGAGDLAALADVLADDYIHVMGTGTIKDKASYIETIRNGPRTPERGDLRVRLYGDTAVVTGPLLNRIGAAGQPTRIIDTVVTQVAVKSGGRWRFVSFQITPKRDSV